MAYEVSLTDAEAAYPEFTFIERLPQSAHKAAFHVQDGRGNDLCLKLVSPDFEIDRLQREILAMHAIEHPNVARLIEYVQTTTEDQTRHHMLEEYVEGCDLSDLLIPGEPWALERAARFFALLCDGLSALKEKQLVHRDIKPSNVRVRGDETPVIIDFGVARHLDLPDLTRTDEGARIGSYPFFSTEQWTGTKYDIEHRTDLFAVGLLLYQAVIGQPPFLRPGLTVTELKEAVCSSSEHVTDPRFLGLPSGWRILVSRLLEKERVKRPADAVQVAALLRDLERI